MRFKFRPIYIGILTVLVGVVLYALDFEFLRVVEFKSYDLRFRLRGHIDAHPDVCIAAVDPKSIDELGRWPWPREVMAGGLSYLNESGASVVGLDIVFSEPEKNPVKDEIKKLLDKSYETNLTGRISEFLNRPGGDDMLAEAFSGSKTVGGFFFITMPWEASERDEEFRSGVRRALSNAAFTVTKGDASGAFMIEAFDAEVNIPELSSRLPLSGYFSVAPDDDGVIRRVPMAIRYDGTVYAPLSAKMVSMHKNSAPMLIEFREYGVSGYKIGDSEIPVDEVGNMLVNYHGPGGEEAGTFEYFSFSDIYNRKIDPARLKGKLVLVGATETGIYDMRTTPFGTVYPGVEVHANAISNMLSGSYIMKGDMQVVMDLISIVALGLSLCVLLPKFHKAIYSAASFTVFLGVYYGFIYLMFSSLNMWLNAVYPTIVAVITYGGMEVYRNTVVEKKAKQIKKTFQNYVSSSVVDEMLKSPDSIKLGGEKKVLSVMFSDIRGFTKISESAEPEVITSFLNSFLSPMTKAIFEHQGTLDKYMGDCIMAIWGAPVSLENHAEMSCKAAVEMMRLLEIVKNESTSEIGKAIDIGIGINSGEMIIGNMGSDMIMDYTVIGDNVNLASRLEGINKVYGTNIIISEFTKKLLGETVIPMRKLDIVKVKGKAKPVAIYEILHSRITQNTDSGRLITTYEEALSSYLNRQWADAEEKFRFILEHLRKDDNPSKIFLSRLAYISENPVPDDWDGVTVMKDK